LNIGNAIYSDDMSSGRFRGTELYNANPYQNGSTWTSGTWVSVYSFNLSSNDGFEFPFTANLQGIGSYTLVGTVYKMGSLFNMTVHHSGGLLEARISGWNLQLRQLSGATQTGTSGNCMINKGLSYK
jgi:hypothetical protein